MLDFKQIAANVNLLDFILQQFPEYAIDKDKSDKSQTRLIGPNEQIDVYKGKKEWLYFNRTNPFSGNLRDEGNIIQFLKVRYNGDFKKIINTLQAYLNNTSVEVEARYATKDDINVGSQDWLESLKPLVRINQDYLESRGIDLKIIERNPTLANEIRSFTYQTKSGKSIEVLGFPLKDKHGQINGVELRKPPYKQLTGKFTAPGTRKERAFWYTESKQPTNAYLAESPLDLLSYIQLKGFDAKGIYLATAGRFGSTKAQDIKELLSSSALENLYLLCDNDIHGQTMNLSLASAFIESDQALPVYFKTNVVKGVNKFVLEVSNCNHSLKQRLLALNQVNTLNNAPNFLAIEIPYAREVIEQLINMVNTFVKSVNIQLVTSKAKDWNKELNEHKNRGIQL